MVIAKRTGDRNRSMGNETMYKSEDGARTVETKQAELLRQWPVEKSELDLETRHGRTRVTACGSTDNPPLLLFHPGNSGSVFWIRQIQSYIQSHRVYAVDILGEAGQSEPARPAGKGPAYVEWIEDIYRGLGIHQAALLGVSLGAWMCLKFACAQPERVERLAILSPPGIVPARRSRSVVASLFGAFSGPLGRRLVMGSQLKKSDMDPRLKELFLLTSRHLKPRPRQLPRFTDRQLSQLYCPVMLMVGGRDSYFDTEALVLRVVKAMPQVEVHYRPRDGHYLSDFTRDVDRFLVTNYAPD